MRNTLYLLLFVGFGVFGQTGTLKGKATFEEKGKELVDIFIDKLKKRFSY